MTSTIEAPPAPLLASELYATSQNETCEGESRCYWCGASCPFRWAHREPPPPMFVKTDRRLIKCPGSAYQCKGCWLWGRQRITINFLSSAGFAKGEPPYKDVQCPINWSWYFSEKGAWAVRLDMDAGTLYEILMDPPRRFALSLLTTKDVKNHLQLVTANDPPEIKGDSPLSFNVDNVGYTYSPYELEHALEHGSTGTIPGTQKLIALLGPYKLTDEWRKKKRGRGRPIESFVVSQNPALKVKKSVKSGD